MVCAAARWSSIKKSSPHRPHHRRGYRQHQAYCYPPDNHAVVRRIALAVGAAVLAAAWLLAGAPGTAALTCGLSAARPPNAAELAIRGAWPADTQFDFVLIGTVRALRPVRGDAGAHGERVAVAVEAVLRGVDISVDETIYNPPLGSSGWLTFEVGHRYLIAGYKGDQGLSTWLCTPNQRVDSRDRVAQFIGLAQQPTLPDGAYRPAVGINSALLSVGIALLLLALVTGSWAVRIRLQLTGRFRCRPKRRTAGGE